MRMLSTSLHFPRLFNGVMSLLIAACVAGCASKSSQETTAAGVQTTQKPRILGFLSYYRIDVQQGNFVSQEMVAQLKEGMTPDQVLFVLGTPLLTDMFHANRWDYPFRLQKGTGEITTSRVTVYFKDNRMVRFEGGDLPNEREYLAHLTGTAAPKKPVPENIAAPVVPSSATPPGK